VFAKNHKNLLLSMITLFRQKATKKPPQNGRKIVFFTNYFFGKIHNKNHHIKQAVSFVLQCKLRCGKIKIILKVLVE